MAWPNEPLLDDRAANLTWSAQMLRGAQAAKAHHDLIREARQQHARQVRLSTAIASLAGCSNV
jgi:hypothetical protein